MLLSVIPARGGSKGVTNKNLRRIGEKSLVQIAVEYAKSEPEIDRIIISTDSIEIAGEFMEEKFVNNFVEFSNGKLIHLSDHIFLHKRDPKNATDFSPTVETILDLLSDDSLANFDSLLLLQPTSPFRIPGELNKMIKILGETQTDACVSAKLFDSPHPCKSFSLNKRGILEVDKFDSLSIPRQQLDELYVFDGAFYLSQIHSIRERRSLLASRTSIYFREGLKTLNIDNEEDMQIALAIANKFQNQ